MLFVLAKFDVRVGNQVVWTSESVDHSALPGVEFKMIPSGLHDRSTDTIFFVSGNWQGISVYEGRSGEPSEGRENVRMYSLAALVPLTDRLPWNQEASLRSALSKFVDNPSSFSELPTRPSARLDPQSHPVLSVISFLKTYGPLVFELWKAGLTRARLLLAAIPGQSIRSMSHYTYIASQISVIPSDVADLLPQTKPPVPSLYNVAISDLQRLQSAESFVATTTDGLLLSPSRDACDAYADQTTFHDLTSSSPGKTVGSTWRDRHRFRLLVDALSITGVPYSSGIIESIVDSTANGMIWWASAGESSIMEREETAPLLSSPASPGPSSSPAFDLSNDGVALVGQFQQYTRQLIRVFARIAQDDDTVIRVGIQDIAAMGLDPVARSDREFLQRFALTWWDRPVAFVGFDCCCCY